MKSVAESRVIIDHDHVLNSDTKLSIFVESRFVRYAHADLKLNLAASVYALGTLVHAVKRADSMARAMFVVNSISPEVSSGQGVKIGARVGAAFRPNSSLKIKNTKKDLGVSSFLFSGGLGASELNGPSDVSCPVKVLNPRI